MKARFVLDVQLLQRNDCSVRVTFPIITKNVIIQKQPRARSKVKEKNTER